ncbi:tryptophan halogenase family protein [Streptomyces sp. NRRL S-87]|uniref:tryptophan halogenase family protein n=1 Tax=Streptomyces sp. NRRL S-87 TaxID=1463920 RepID=UPI0004C02A9E|nr:tryptophan halogenase family protein [Streptomyces sp. NRRL S-87]
MNSRRIEKVVVLGGGADGWMTAAHLARALRGTVGITVLEAPGDAPVPGAVGMATLPPFHRCFFDLLGVNEDEWMRACGATFRTATRFVNWRTEGPCSPLPRELPGGGPDHFYHSTGLLPDCDGLPLSSYWLLRTREGRTTEPFDYACFREPPLMDARLAPRWLDGRAATRYAWHLDAALLTGFVRRLALREPGVRAVEGGFAGAERDGRGFVTAVRTDDGRRWEGDLFVDCSGSAAALLGGELAEPFLDLSGELLCDRAVVARVPHADRSDTVDPYTSAVAVPSGWVWRTPLRAGFTTGHVHHSALTTPEEAVAELGALWGADAARGGFDVVGLRVGRVRRAWVGNVVAVGTAAGSLGPLQPTDSHFLVAALHRLVTHFPDRDVDPALADGYNRDTEEVFEESRDFVRAHLAFAPRTDTAFWRAVKEPELPAGLRRKTADYRAGLPVVAAATDEAAYYGAAGRPEAELRTVWTDGHYYSILTGLGTEPARPLPALAHHVQRAAAADEVFTAVKRQQRILLDTLPTAYECLKHLYGG